MIIPCYNQGGYLEESVGAVLGQTYTDVEIIIVNDGSNDSLTLNLLKEYQDDRIVIVHTINQGLAAARNNGITAASGEYILPLDADDKIDKSYIEKAVALLDSDRTLGIVYSRAQLFGGIDDEWPLPEYSIQEMMKDNIIFCSAVFRRSDWETVGGYDTSMIYGWEDYDFWLSLIERGRKVYRIPELLFYYRVETDSMVRSKDLSQKVEMFARIYRKHQALFSQNIEIWLESMLSGKESYYTSRLYIDTGNGISDAESISRKVDKTTAYINFSLDDIEGVQSLRFDPIDVPAIIELESISCGFKSGEQLKVEDYWDNSLMRVGNVRYFDTNDSQCFLNLSSEEFSNLESVSVHLRFKAMEAEALAEMVDEMKQKTDALKKESGRKKLTESFLKLFS